MIFSELFVIKFNTYTSV